MKKSISLVLFVFAIIFSVGLIHHKSVNSLNIPSSVSANWCSGGSGCPQPGNTACNQTPWQDNTSAGAGATASLISPALGTNCTKHVLTLMTAMLYDGGESCFQGLNVYDGNTIIWRTWLGDDSTNHANLYNFNLTFPITSFLHNNTDGTQTLQVLGFGPQTSGALKLAFGGNCAHSTELLSFNGFDE